MQPSPTFTPAPQRRRRQRKATQPAATPPVLVAASYDSGTLIELTFDVVIDVSGLVPSAFIVFDGPGSLEYVGDGAPTVVSPMQILLALSEVGPTGGAAVLLTVQSVNGIVAVEGGAPFAGIAALEMPYP